MQTTLCANHQAITRMRAIALATFSVFAFAFAAPGARAACGQFSGANAGGIKLPAIAALSSSMAGEDNEASNWAGRDSVVACGKPSTRPAEQPSLKPSNNGTATEQNSRTSRTILKSETFVSGSGNRSVFAACVFTMLAGCSTQPAR